MSDGGDRIEHVFSSESIALANAIALRSGIQAAITEQILAELQGSDYREPTPEELRGTHLGRATLYLAKVENPDINISLSEIIDASDGATRLVRTANEHPDVEIDESAAMQFMQAFGSEIQKTSTGLFSDEKLTEDFKKTLEAARQVATENGVEVSEVYETDDYYYEACKRAQKPEEAVTEAITAINEITGDMFTNIIMGQMMNLLPKDLLDDLTPEDIQEMVLGMQLDPDFQKSMEDNAEQYREGIRQASLYFLTKTYGKGVINNLNVSEMLTLMPKRQLARVVSDAL